MVKADYTMENMLKCIYCICTVQKSNSDCARQRTKKNTGNGEGRSGHHFHLKPEKFPWLYCAIVEAKCEDLNFEEECICKDCGVWIGIRFKR